MYAYAISARKGLTTKLCVRSGDNFNVEDVLFNWIAPEVLVGELYTQASDVYSLALVLWEIIASEVPFHVAGEMRGSHVMRNQVWLVSFSFLLKYCCDSCLMFNPLSPSPPVRS
jgi:serine/threonine protein kinase